MLRPSPTFETQKDIFGKSDKGFLIYFRMEKHLRPRNTDYTEYEEYRRQFHFQSQMTVERLRTL